MHSSKMIIKLYPFFVNVNEEHNKTKHLIMELNFIEEVFVVSTHSFEMQLD
jgi:hypothetical protein